MRLVPSHTTHRDILRQKTAFPMISLCKVMRREELVFETIRNLKIRNREMLMSTLYNLEELTGCTFNLVYVKRKTIINKNVQSVSWGQCSNTFFSKLTPSYRQILH